MIKSMTAYSSTILNLKSHKVIIEIKCLNSKNLDLSCKIPSELKERDNSIRTKHRRIIKIKKKIKEDIVNLNLKIDNNRFEQELIYYLEKYDINEEIVRLNSHINFFTSVIKAKSPNGKKLGFISQEIGREINTIGSKSYDSGMQKIVVEMKDELEKIKEQILNIL